MPDISKCIGIKENIECSIKDKCWRFTSKPSEYQLYMIPIGDIKEGCPSFWDNKHKS